MRSIEKRLMSGTLLGYFSFPSLLRWFTNRWLNSWVKSRLYAKRNEKLWKENKHSFDSKAIDGCVLWSVSYGTTNELKANFCTTDKNMRQTRVGRPLGGPLEEHRRSTWAATTAQRRTALNSTRLSSAIITSLLVHRWVYDRNDCEHSHTIPYHTIPVMGSAYLLCWQCIDHWRAIEPSVVQCFGAAVKTQSKHIWIQSDCHYFYNLWVHIKSFVFSQITHNKESNELSLQMKIFWFKALNHYLRDCCGEANRSWEVKPNASVAHSNQTHPKS